MVRNSNNTNNNNSKPQHCCCRKIHKKTCTCCSSSSFYLFILLLFVFCFFKSENLSILKITASHNPKQKQKQKKQHNIKAQNHQSLLLSFIFPSLYHSYSLSHLLLLEVSCSMQMQVRSHPCTWALPKSNLSARVLFPLFLFLAFSLFKI